MQTPHISGHKPGTFEFQSLMSALFMPHKSLVGMIVKSDSKRDQVFSYKFFEIFNYMITLWHGFRN
jgi:hypothetical protein